MHAVLYCMTGISPAWALTQLTVIMPIDRDHGKNEVKCLIEHFVVTRMLALLDNSFSVTECQYFG